MTVTTLEIIRADKQLWREYLSSRTNENKANIESYENLKWILVPAKESVKDADAIRKTRNCLKDLFEAEDSKCLVCSNVADACTPGPDAPCGDEPEGPSEKAMKAINEMGFSKKSDGEK